MADAGGAVRRHDPAQQLNEQHRDQLLDIARSLTGHPGAVSAHAAAIDDGGIDLVIGLAAGTTVGVRVPFAAPAVGARRRLAFQDLASRAAEHRSFGSTERTWP